MNKGGLTRFDERSCEFQPVLAFPVSKKAFQGVVYCGGNHALDFVAAIEPLTWLDERI